MQSNQSIGTISETIVVVNIRLDGTIIPALRRREPGGRMVDVAPPRFQEGQHLTHTEFVARVHEGELGVVAIGPKRWGGEYSAAIIPLGEEPTTSLQAHDDPLSAAANEIRFRYADGKLTWKSENVSGEAVINETYPELAVALRLPPGNHGEISFASPLFTTADGEPASVLSVA